jgi:hypothetical protein
MVFEKKARRSWILRRWDGGKCLAPNRPTSKGVWHPLERIAHRGYNETMYSIGIAYLLWFVSGFGVLGFHRFYLGKIPTGLLWMCTGGLCLVGSIYDFFTLPRQVRRANMERAMFGSYGPQLWASPVAAKEVETVERSILRLAKANGGMVTASELALSANLSLEQAKKDLDGLVNKGFAEIRVRKTGTIVYTLPDMMDRNAPLEDF